MIAPLLALLLIQTEGSAAHAVQDEIVDLGHPLSGADYLLVAEAARRPEMQGVNLACYRIYVFDDGGSRTVAFVEARQRVIEGKTKIVFLPPDPKCRSISFVFTPTGRVARVIHTRE